LLLNLSIDWVDIEMVKVAKIFLAVLLITNFVIPVAQTQAEPGITIYMDASEQAKQLLNRMTDEERVGQLFLVTFQGTDTSTTSQIYDLVVNRHVGGVILRSENNNIPSELDVLQPLYSLTYSLQSIRYQASQTGVVDPQTGKNFIPEFVPLFIGIAQEGDGYPTDQILSGLTQMPSQMAMGATWNTDLALQAGNVVGNELQALGINLLLGPSLDVLESPRTEGGLDLGVRTFGGDPFWVGEMAKAYISGVHQGSHERIVVVAKHFPGYGGSDRLPGEEVATVRKSLEQLKQIELAPFLAVCSDLTEKAHVTDALLVSHIRYQGFQGNIRATTRPVSFDSTALSQLTSLPVIAEWRDQGGLLISDDLGSRAVRRFYDPAEKLFDARQVARNAFLAGNDMLYMGNVRSNTDSDNYSSILHTLDSFTQKYREDPSFATRVDESVLNILTKKFQMYPSFDLVNTVPSAYRIVDVGDSSQTTFNILQQAATLISPDEQNLAINLPNPPSLNEDLVFFTSTLSGKQCSTCLEKSIFSVDGFESAVLKNYGPPNAREVRSEMLSSYSFKDLSAFLSNVNAPEELEYHLTQADWLVFALLDVSPSSPETHALITLLENKYDLIRNKKVIVFAFSAPYFLDATDISKITAYYGIYSKVPEALDIASRILFHELIPEGFSPVSIVGSGYDLIQVTAPDPDQIIPLTLDLQSIDEASLTGTPQPTEIPMFQVGDKLPLKAGVILDQNANPVPDGTTVRFIITRTGDTTTTQQVDAVTSDGFAFGKFTIDSRGLYDIKVVSEPALVSQILLLNVTSEMSAIVTAVAPTAITESPIDSESDGVTKTAPETDSGESTRATSFGVWFAALLILLCEVTIVYYLFSRSAEFIRWRIRAAMLTLISGWLVYLYLAFELPGTKDIPVISILLITAAAGGIGLGILFLWRWVLMFVRQAD
jgi:beta-N-acetylhexosaminidase